MLKNLVVIVSLAGLAACGDPLAKLDRVSDLELTSTDPVASALPSDAEITREGFFGTQVANPVQDAAPVAEVQTSQPEPEPKRGLLGFFKPKDPVPEASVATDTDSADADDAVNLALSGAEQDSDAASPASPGAVKLASLEPESVPKRRGLFGRSVPSALVSTQSDDVTDVAYGTVLPFGVIARDCEARRKPLGRKIESASARGYKLYDSDPGTTGPRTYYITGFDDDCPRQLTAANVLLAAPSLYEQLHYGPTGGDLAYAETDKAYDKLKQKVCGVRKGKPCGNKMDRMDKSAFFVTSYARFDSNARWSEVLIHDGVVMASAIKSHN
jgi:hypothetical protein